VKPAEQLAVIAASTPRSFDVVLRPSRLEVFQINVGKFCNITCRHCHVDAGPTRTDAMMSRATV